MSEGTSNVEVGVPHRREPTAYKVVDSDAARRVAEQLRNTPERRRAERTQNIKKIVELERSAITRFQSLRDGATEENFNNPETATLFPHVDTSEEGQEARNALAKSAWVEFCLAYPDKVGVYKAYSDAQGDAFRLIAGTAEVQGMLERFKTEHPDAHNIALKVGMSARDKFGNELPADQRWWPKEISTDPSVADPETSSAQRISATVDAYRERMKTSANEPRSNDF